MKTYTLATKWDNTIDDESMDIDIEVDFQFMPPTRPLAPSLTHAGEPGEGPRVDYIGAWRVFSIGRTKLPPQVENAILNSAHIKELCIEHAQESE